MLVASVVTSVASTSVASTAVVVAWVFHDLFEEALHGPAPMPMAIRVACGVALVSGLAAIRALGS